MHHVAVSMIWATFDDKILKKELPVNYTDEIAAPAAAWINLLQPSLSRTAGNQEYRPNSCERPVTHAFIAMDEAIPLLLLRYFQTLLQLASKCSVERNVKGLSTRLFEDSGCYLARTYAFNEDPEKRSFSLSFGNRRRGLLQQHWVSCSINYLISFTFEWDADSLTPPIWFIYLCRYKLLMLPLRIQILNI